MNNGIKDQDHQLTPWAISKPLRYRTGTESCLAKPPCTSASCQLQPHILNKWNQEKWNSMTIFKENIRKSIYIVWEASMPVVPLICLYMGVRCNGLVWCKYLSFIHWSFCWFLYYSLSDLFFLLSTNRMIFLLFSLFSVSSPSYALSTSLKSRRVLRTQSSFTHSFST